MILVGLVGFGREDVGSQRAIARRDRDHRIEQRREILTHVNFAVLAADENGNLTGALRDGFRSRIGGRGIGPTRRCRG